jgi:hypothetical protein
VAQYDIGSFHGAREQRLAVNAAGLQDDDDDDDDDDDSEGLSFCSFLYTRQIIVKIGTRPSISAGCSTYGIRDKL